MAKYIKWREGIKEYGYKCARCGKLVFDKEKGQLIGTYEKRNIFDTATVVCCARCGDGVGVLIND